MSLAMAAAAAAGFLGASQMGSAFVASPAGQQAPTLRGSAAMGASAQPAAAAPASNGISAALCVGACAGAVSAMSVKSKSRVSRKAGFDPTSSVGVIEPTGFWDPCGVMKERVGKDGWQWKDEAAFDRYRAAELKHGRLAMMASLGMVANTFWKFPGFEGVPDGLQALYTGQGGSGFGIIALLVAGVELNHPEGKFSDPLKIGTYDNWGYSKEMQNKEIANGRMAMASVLTLWITEYGTKMGPVEQLSQLNLVNCGIPLMLLGFAWGNPDGWKKGEYVPSLMGNSTAPAKKVSIAPSVPKTEDKTETEKVAEKADA